MKQKYNNSFIRSAGVVFAISGSAKVLSAHGTAKILTVADPILGLQFGHLMLLVGALELIGAAACLSGRLLHQTTVMVAWFATNVFAYRLGLWWIGWHRPCSCLGNVTDAVHISPQAADMAMRVILAYLLIGSYATLFWLWRQRNAALPTSVQN